ncbi:hypothetical protein NQ315_016523 [Exocentrus adspersus]|uniref:Nose resistant-to-fluoxetine protein N-terminal domain-containing protein n=1 Tax=Exocentrus adspersus TaxID=1586481 RepID=A0AAV8VYF2_9CUCU|nr:hypothetical protein NQ315_016523 [Exocentrus adspersus]
MHTNIFTFLLGLTACYTLGFLNQALAISAEVPVINSSALVEIDNDINRMQRGNEFAVTNNKSPLSVGNDNNKPTTKHRAVTAISAAKTANGGGTKLYQNENDNEFPSKQRKPVKLTMKQGLTMNQVIATYALTDVKNDLCKNHTEEFKLGLRALEPWALQMFDSSSKIPSGILNGNLAEYGAYSQCLNIYKDSQYGPIRGRHCSFRVTPTDKLLLTILGYRNVSAKRFQFLKRSVMEGVKLMWSVCVPDSCHFSDVFPHFNRSITELTEGLDLAVSLKEEHCISLEDEPKLTRGGYLVILFMGFIIIIVFITTIVDLGFQVLDEPNWFVGLFSAYSNGKRLFSTKSSDVELECLNGLRYISICYVVIGHRYIQNMIFPSANSIDLIYWVQRYFSTLVMGGTISVDTFFLIGSTLLSYHFILTVTRTDSFNLLHFYLYRNIRILMPLAVVTAIYATLLHYFGSGPTWHDSAYAFQRPCQVFWWSTLLHLQAYINPDALCIIQTWYLSDDMLFYYLSPVILVPLWKWPKFGYVNLVLIYILSVVSSFYVAWSNKFDGGDANYTLDVLGQYFNLLKSIFSSIRKLECDFRGAVNYILAHPVFKILGRIAYSVYLLHYGIQGSMQAARKAPDYFSDFLTLYTACSDIVLITLLGIPFTLCFEYPFVGMASLVIKSGKSRKKIMPDNMKEKLEV